MKTSKRYAPKKRREVVSDVPMEVTVDSVRVPLSRVRANMRAITHISQLGNVRIDDETHLDMVEQEEQSETPWTPYEEAALRKPAMADDAPGKQRGTGTPPSPPKPKEGEEDYDGAAVEVGRRGPLRRQKDAFERPKPGSKRELEPTPDDEEGEDQ